MCAGGGAENDIGAADVFFQKTSVLCVAGGEDACFGLVAVLVTERVLVVRIFWEGVVESHQHLSCSIEGAVDDIDMVNLCAAEKESQTDMPVGLFACTEDGQVVHFVSSLEKHAASQSGTEGSEFLSVDQCVGVSLAIEQGQGATRCRRWLRFLRCRWNKSRTRHGGRSRLGTASGRVGRFC